jgi:hypothetical protein
MNSPNNNFGGATPDAVIEEGDGHLVEAVVEKMVHMHEGFVTLLSAYERFRDVPELADTWSMFNRAWPTYQTAIEG